MGTTRINRRLIQTLPKVLRVQRKVIIEDTGIPSTTWDRIVENPLTLTVKRLIQMADGLHIPVRRFFSTGCGDFIGRREDYVMQNYLPCFYDSESVAELLGQGSSITYREAAASIGKHWKRISSTLTAESRLTVEQYLTFCESFDLDPFEFLVDPNPEETEESATLTEQMAVKLIAELSSQVADLRKEVAALRAEVKKPADRHGIDYSDEDSSSMPMAAEGEGGEE